MKRGLFRKINISAVVLLLLLACSKERRSTKAASKMQDFVTAISQYARGFDSDFIVIPQNGVELAFNDADAESGLKSSYLSAIDGFGVEELFYNGSAIADDGRLSLLQQVQPTHTVLVSEYVDDASNEQDARNKNTQQGFLSFIRSKDYYDYQTIPAVVPNENSSNIHSLKEVKNYLYMISNGQFASKNDMIVALSKTNYDLLIIDLFFEDEALTSEDLKLLKVKSNGAKRLVVSYMNVGSAEKYRYYWKKGWGQHHPLWIKRKYEGYPDEFWVKFWKKQWQEIIYGNDDSYTKKLIDAGFDGAYLDNVEAYYFLYYKD